MGNGKEIYLSMKTEDPAKCREDMAAPKEETHSVCIHILEGRESLQETLERILRRHREETE